MNSCIISIEWQYIILIKFVSFSWKYREMGKGGGIYPLVFRGLITIYFHVQ